MNVLLTSVGRRSYLVHYFHEALSGQGKVIGANMFAKTPGMFAVDVAVVVPPANELGYVEALLSICQKHNVKLLCSLHDLDVFILSQHREKFERMGVVTTLPNSDWGRIALDKYECASVLEQAGVPAPVTFFHLETALSAVKNGEIRFPLVVKARFGFGSLGLRFCRSEKELLDAYSHVLEQVMASESAIFVDTPAQDSVIIQPAIQGREVCIGVCNDLEGCYHAHFACEVHAMRAGESDAATSIARAPFESMARKVSSATHHPGIWGIDLLDDNGTFRVIDVNPRFTGDYPFHHLAGCNIPAALIEWVVGKTPNPAYFKHTEGIAGYKDYVPKRI